MLPKSTRSNRRRRVALSTTSRSPRRATTSGRRWPITSATPTTRTPTRPIGTIPCARSIPSWGAASTTNTTCIRNAPTRRGCEPEPRIKINAADARERGISQGDVVRVYNDHGYAVLKALVTEGIKPGVVSIPHGFQADQFIEGHTQDLTSVVMNDFCSNSAFYDFLCEVERCEGGDR